MEQITVGDLKEMLEGYEDDMELSFSGLDFYRLKQRSPKVVQVEFNQVVYKDDQGLVYIDNAE